MKKKLLIAFLAGLLIDLAIQEVRIISKLNKLRKSRKKTEELKKQVEKLKDEIALAKCKQQIEWYKKNDPLKAEIEKYINLSKQISKTKDEEELNKVLEKAVEEGDIQKPWDGDFREFMSNPNNTLHF